MKDAKADKLLKKGDYFDFDVKYKDLINYEMKLLETQMNEMQMNLDKNIFEERLNRIDQNNIKLGELRAKVLEQNEIHAAN